MKTKKTVLTGILVGSLLVTVSGFAGEKGGNGGDALELTPSASGDGGKVFVPVPGGFGLTGTLLVTSTLDQGNYVTLSSCKTDANGQPVKHGCSYIDNNGGLGNYDIKQYAINQPILLNPGTYLIDYSNMKKLVKVEANLETQVALEQLQVGNSTQSNVHFSVFLDLTDPSTQKRFWEQRALWDGYAADQSGIDKICSAPVPQDVKACAAWMSGDFQALLNTVVQFNQDGSFGVWDFSTDKKNDGYAHQFIPQGRILVSDPVAGQSVSVFPGVYAIEFTDTLTGQTQDQFGVKVE